MTTLLAAALDVALAGSSLIGLINALWGAGLREEVDSLVTTAVSRLSGAEVIVLTVELRAVGREQTAFGLRSSTSPRRSGISGMTRPSDRAIAHATTILPTDDVLALASELREPTALPRPFRPRGPRYRISSRCARRPNGKGCWTLSSSDPHGTSAVC